MYFLMTYNDEVFYDIIQEGLKPFYAVSNYGRVINKSTGKEMSWNIDRYGYPRVSLMMIDNTPRKFLVHRLVMLAINPISNPEKFDVDHLQGNKMDSRYENLGWCTHKENIRRAHANKFYK